jgi:hypothetical protein
VIITERTRERSARARYAKDAQLEQPSRSYSFARAGSLWMPKGKRLELLGGGPCGSFAARGGAPDELWQPTSVSGFALDLNPRFKVTTGLDGSRVTCTQIVNNCPSTTDTFANGNGSLQPTFEASGWGGNNARPSLLGDGVAYYLTCTTGLASSFAGGNDTPFSFFIAGQFVSLSGGGNANCPLFLGSSTDNLPLWDFFAQSGAWKSNKRGNSGSIAPVSGGTSDTAKHLWDFVQYGTTLDMGVDSTLVQTAASQDVVSLTINRMALFGTYAAAVPANLANFRLARLLGFTGAISSADRSYVRSTLTSLYL